MFRDEFQLKVEILTIGSRIRERVRVEPPRRSKLRFGCLKRLREDCSEWSVHSDFVE